MSHDDPWPIDTPGNLTGPANQSLGFMLGPEIGMLQPGCLFEHILPECTLVKPGGGDRGGMVKAARANLFGQRDGVTSTVDICLFVGFGIGLEVVDGSKMKEVTNPALQLVQVLVRYPERGFTEIPTDCNNAILVIRPALRDKPVELGFGAASDQHMDLALALEQLIDQVTPDESGPPVTK